MRVSAGIRSRGDRFPIAGLVSRGHHRLDLPLGAIVFGYARIVGARG